VSVYSGIDKLRSRAVRLLPLCLLLLPIAGCGDGETPRSAPPAVPPLLTELRADLMSFVAGDLPYVQSYSEGYSIPSPPELAEFDALATALIEGRLDDSRLAAEALDYELVRLLDAGAGDNVLYCLRERLLKGRGFFCTDPDSPALHHISVPHPLYDSSTNTGSVTVMRETGARFLSISSAHRCANAAESPCSGTTSACGEDAPYKVSDAAHNVNSFFHRFGVAVSDSNGATYTIQLHGCGSAACPADQDTDDIVARLSAGTTDDLADSETVNRLHAALNRLLEPLDKGSALSCSRPAADKQLCGTTNPLGRYINGQADACTNPGTSFTGSRWLHVEQNANLRRADGAGDAVTPSTIATAINDTL
jgi:hypothetical protein